MHNLGWYQPLALVKAVGCLFVCYPNYHTEAPQMGTLTNLGAETQIPILLRSVCSGLPLTGAFGLRIGDCKGSSQDGDFTVHCSLVAAKTLTPKEPETKGMLSLASTLRSLLN